VRACVRTRECVCVRRLPLCQTVIKHRWFAQCRHSAHVGRQSHGWVAGDSRTVLSPVAQCGKRCNRLNRCPVARSQTTSVVINAIWDELRLPNVNEKLHKNWTRMWWRVEFVFTHREFLLFVFVSCCWIIEAALFEIKYILKLSPPECSVLLFEPHSRRPLYVITERSLRVSGTCHLN